MKVFTMAYHYRTLTNIELSVLLRTAEGKFAWWAAQEFDKRGIAVRMAPKQVQHRQLEALRMHGSFTAK